MSKPYLIVVTGQPGAGKTTFSKALGSALFMPVISRDEIKEGYVQSFGVRHTELPQEANGFATDAFFDTLKTLVNHNVSVVAEAAFQHRLWAPRLEWFMDRARIYVLICTVDGKVALERFLKRGLENESREYFHGDKGVDMVRRGLPVEPGTYDAPHLDVPTFHIDTLGEYHPSIEELKETILHGN